CPRERARGSLYDDVRGIVRARYEREPPLRQRGSQALPTDGEHLDLRSVRRFDEPCRGLRRGSELLLGGAGPALGQVRRYVRGRAARVVRHIPVWNLQGIALLYGVLD